MIPLDQKKSNDNIISNSRTIKRHKNVLNRKQSIYHGKNQVLINQSSQAKYRNSICLPMNQRFLQQSSLQRDSLSQNKTLASIFGQYKLKIFAERMIKSLRSRMYQQLTKNDYKLINDKSTSQLQNQNDKSQNYNKKIGYYFISTFDSIPVFKASSKYRIGFDMLNFVIIIIIMVYIPLTIVLSQSFYYLLSSYVYYLILMVMSVEILMQMNTTYSKKDSFHLSIQQRNILRLIKLLIILIYVSHLLACIWIFVDTVIQEENSWVTDRNIQNESWQVKYIHGIYFSVTTMSTVGYGDISPQNEQELIVCIVTMFISCGIFAYAVNSIGQIFSDIFIEQQKIEDHLFIINSYMKRKNISFSLQCQIRQYLEYYWEQKSQENIEQENQIITQLSDQLKEQLMLEANKIVLKDSYIFKGNFSDKFITKAVNIIKEISYQPEQIVDTRSENCIYFIDSGSVEFYIEINKPGNEKELNSIKKLETGQCFGYFGFFSGEHVLYKIRSIEFTKVLVIDRNQFIDLLKEFPQDYEMFCQIKDAIIYSKDSNKIGEKCVCCKKTNHDFLDCPMIHPSFDHFKIIKQYNLKFQVQKRDVYYERLQNFKDNVFNKIDEKMNGIEQLFQNQADYLAEQEWFLNLESDSQCTTTSVSSSQQSSSSQSENSSEQSMTSSHSSSYESSVESYTEFPKIKDIMKKNNRQSRQSRKLQKNSQKLSVFVQNPDTVRNKSSSQNKSQFGDSQNVQKNSAFFNPQSRESISIVVNNSNNNHQSLLIPIQNDIKKRLSRQYLEDQDITDKKSYQDDSRKSETKKNTFNEQKIQRVSFINGQIPISPINNIGNIVSKNKNSNFTCIFEPELSQESQKNLISDLNVIQQGENKNNIDNSNTQEVLLNNINNQLQIKQIQEKRRLTTFANILSQQRKSVMQPNLNGLNLKNIKKTNEDLQKIDEQQNPDVQIQLKSNPIIQQRGFISFNPHQHKIEQQDVDKQNKKRKKLLNVINKLQKQKVDLDQKLSKTKKISIEQKLKSSQRKLSQIYQSGINQEQEIKQQQKQKQENSSIEKKKKQQKQLTQGIHRISLQIPDFRNFDNKKNTKQVTLISLPPTSSSSDENKDKKKKQKISETDTESDTSDSENFQYPENNIKNKISFQKSYEDENNLSQISQNQNIKNAQHKLSIINCMGQEKNSKNYLIQNGKMSLIKESHRESQKKKFPQMLQIFKDDMRKIKRISSMKFDRPKEHSIIVETIKSLNNNPHKNVQIKDHRKSKAKKIKRQLSSYAIGCNRNKALSEQVSKNFDFRSTKYNNIKNTPFQINQMREKFDKNRQRSNSLQKLQNNTVISQRGGFIGNRHDTTQILNSTENQQLVIQQILGNDQLLRLDKYKEQFYGVDHFDALKNWKKYYNHQNHQYILQKIQHIQYQKKLLGMQQQQVINVVLGMNDKEQKKDKINSPVKKMNIWKFKNKNNNNTNTNKEILPLDNQIQIIPELDDSMVQPQQSPQQQNKKNIEILSQLQNNQQNDSTQGLEILSPMVLSSQKININRN